MEKLLEELLDGMEPEELDDVLPEEITVDLSRAALARIERGALTRAHLQTVKHPRLRPWLRSIAVACLVIMIGAVGVFGVACAAEVREYREATEFFSENELSAQGLSRAEVKAVYRDITSHRITCDKTADVVKNSVKGMQILQGELNPDELLERRRNKKEQPTRGLGYRIDYDMTEVGSGDHKVLVRTDVRALECTFDGVLLWEVEFSEFSLRDYAPDPDGLTVWGSDASLRAWLARVDLCGNILWCKPLEHGYKNEYIETVLDNGDGTCAVISDGNFGCASLSQYDPDGNELSFCQFGQGGIAGAVRSGDDYLVAFSTGGTVLKIDRAGNRIAEFNYNSENCDYYCEDVAVFGDRIYISTYTEPKSEQIYKNGKFLDYIDSVLEFDPENDTDRCFVEGLTPLVRDHYTAVLLVCGTDGGEPETFYSVNGAFGRALTVDGERLCWDVDSIYDTVYLSRVSSFPVSVQCEIFCYTFDSSGALVGQEDTEKALSYQIHN